VQRGTARSASPRLQGTGWMMGGKTGSADVRRGQRADGWFAGRMYDDEGAARYTVVVYLQGGAPGGRMPSAVAAEMTRHMATRARAEVEAAEAEAP
jgi:cell division protein FtsI/penicillin-binding protein 2